MLAAAGISHPSEIGPQHLERRVSATEVRQFSELHTFLTAGELIEGTCEADFYNRNWAMAKAEAF